MKKILSAIIAIVVVIILVIAILEVLVLPSSVPTMTVSVSSSIASAGTNLTFAAFISGGTPSKVVFNFGDGTTGIATHLLGNEYTVVHSYSSAGKYLVTANATVNGISVNNLKGVIEVSVTPATVSPALASEITAPSILTLSQIVSPGSTVSLTASILQPPTATNWTIGYYIWNFGNGSTTTNYTVFNTSSGNFMPGTVFHTYSTAGIYSVTLGVITFNATNYVPTTYISNGIKYIYYPVSELSSILSSGQYHNTTYMITIVVNSNAQLLKSTIPYTNPNEIIVTEVVPGGAFTFDPAIDYESVGMEVIVNVYETLISYNGSSTTQLFPMVASEIPTLANGGISANYLNYTFHIRNGLKFANGDPLTAWDVYTSFIRTLLFVQGSPGTPGWILAQDLLPGGGFAPGLYTNGTSLYNNITRAITYNNITQTVTFHLLKPDPAFLYYIADPQGAAIMDYSWLVAHGAGITFTPAGFLAYTKQSNEADYNTYVKYHAMGSGPYIIKSYLIGQSILLAPNPYYTPIPGVPGYDHVANDTIYIQWEKDLSTALLIAKNGLTDIIEGLPNYDYPIMAQLQSEGKINIISYPTFSLNFFNFNFNINTTMLSTFGMGFSVPPNYFANLDVRKAFAYAFNYTNYVENLLGNAKYGADFGFHYTGIIPLGMPGYMNDSQLQQAGAVVPTYNLTIAKEYMEESGLYNTSINIPIVVMAGDTLNYAAAGMWATALSFIDPHISVTPLYLPHDEILGYIAANENPMPIYTLPGTWTPDYPFPSDYINGMYWQEGFYPSGDGMNYTNIVSAGYAQEANEFQELQTLIANGEAAGNATQSLHYYDEAEVLAVNLTLMVYTYQQNNMWFFEPYLHGFQYEMNPMFGGSTPDQDLLYIYLTKE
ncbi:MAG: ABC transporter substrate-binding protein [Thermoplasmata archaeon]